MFAGRIFHVRYVVFVLFLDALRYKPEDRGSDSQWDHSDFHWLNPSGRTLALESTQPLTQMNTRIVSWGIKAAGA